MPVTGVIQRNHVEWIEDEIFGSNAIDLDFEAHVEDCETCKGDGYCPERENMEMGTVLIGSWMKRLITGSKYEPDPRGEYAAIVREFVVQVVWSKTVEPVRAWCSPCYPGQADLDSGPGSIDAYSLPADLIGEGRKW